MSSPLPTSVPAAAVVADSRATAIRSAEKLLRIGKLDLAIDEYRRIVSDHPDDTATATILGNLYFRAGETEQGIEQFVQIADGLQARGLAAEAAAIYRTIVAKTPDCEHALLQLADIACAQQQLAEAHAYFTRVAAQRSARGDGRGAAEMAIRIAALDPEDFDARLTGARARQQVGDLAGALEDFSAIADAFLRRGQHAAGASVLREAAILAPGDETLRDRLVDAHLLAGHFSEARTVAATPAHWRRLATTLLASDHEDTLDVLREAASQQPSDTVLQAALARWFIARGDAIQAAAHLHPEMAEGDPGLLLAIAELHLRGGRDDDAVLLVQQCLARNDSLVGEVSALALHAAGAVPNTAWRIMRIAVEGWTAESAWSAAATSLETFLQRVPGWIPALTRLVEIAIDGGLEDVACRAQGQLADAYLQAGAAIEAVVVIEDLVMRERDNPAHLERFRRALHALGEADAEAAIQQRLGSGPSPAGT